jgi:hypothetical protein
VTGNDGAWERPTSTLILDRLPWFRVFADRVRLPDGREIDSWLRIHGRPYAVVSRLRRTGVSCLWRVTSTVRIA